MSSASSTRLPLLHILLKVLSWDPRIFLYQRLLTEGVRTRPAPWQRQHPMHARMWGRLCRGGHAAELPHPGLMPALPPCCRGV